jgi:hypothetical protein
MRLFALLLIFPIFGFIHEILKFSFKFSWINSYICNENLKFEIEI